LSVTEKLLASGEDLFNGDASSSDNMALRVQIQLVNNNFNICGREGPWLLLNQPPASHQDLCESTDGNHETSQC
jgi:hypothetical protein